MIRIGEVAFVMVVVLMRWLREDSVRTRPAGRVGELPDLCP
jgi:hypothetical protein